MCDCLTVKGGQQIHKAFSPRYEKLMHNTKTDWIMNTIITIKNK